MQRRLRANNRIRVPEVFVIDEQGQRLGVMKTFDALRLAREKELDMVEIVPTQRPPVVKFMDYGRYMYQKGKERRSQRAKTRVQEMKMIRMRYRTDKHDMETKGRKVDEFLKKGHIVTIQLMLRGRENIMGDLGKEKLLSFLEYVSEPYQIIKNVQRQGRMWNVTIRIDQKKADQPSQNK